jgi:hypothetical protein
MSDNVPAASSADSSHPGSAGRSSSKRKAATSTHLNEPDPLRPKRSEEELPAGTSYSSVRFGNQGRSFLSTTGGFTIAGFKQVAGDPSTQIWRDVEPSQHFPPDGQLHKLAQAVVRTFPAHIRPDDDLRSDIEKVKDQFHRHLLTERFYDETFKIPNNLQNAYWSAMKSGLRKLVLDVPNRSKLIIGRMQDQLKSILDANAPGYAVAFPKHEDAVALYEAIKEEWYSKEKPAYTVDLEKIKDPKLNEVAEQLKPDTSSKRRLSESSNAGVDYLLDTLAAVKKFALLHRECNTLKEETTDAAVQLLLEKLSKHASQRASNRIYVARVKYSNFLEMTDEAKLSAAYSDRIDELRNIQELMKPGEWRTVYDSIVSSS